MTTSRFNNDASDGWVQIADVDDVTVFIQNQGQKPVFINFNAVAPSLTDPGHQLNPGKSMIRRAPGKIYAFSNTAADKSNIVVSTVNDLTLNGDFAADANWTKGTGWTIGSGKATSDGSQVGDSDLKETVFTLPPVGTRVRVTYTVVAISAGTIEILAGSGATGVSRGLVGTYTQDVTIAGTQQLIVRADVDFVGSVDNISVKPLV